MADFTFPQVQSSEVDASQYIPNMDTSSAAIVVTTPKGSLSRMLITDNQQFRNEYCVDGKVTLGNASQMSALAYLANGDKLYVQRVVDSATALYGGVKIKTAASVPNNAALAVGVATPAFTTVSGELNLFYVFAKDPGAWNSQLSIIIANVNTGVNLNTNCFDIQVWNTTLGGITSLVETWTVSRKVQVDGYNRQQYLETAINGYSSYIVVKDSALVNTTLPKVNATAVAMVGGVDGTTPTSSQIATGWSAFLNKDEVDCRILINGGAADATVQTAMKTVVDTRLDCVAIFDEPIGSINTAANMVTYATSTTSGDSYTAIYAPWGVVSDPDNAQLVPVPPSGYVASAMAYNDSIGEVWDAVAGTDRGMLPFVKLYFGADTTGKISFTDGELGSLCTAGVNPIRRKTGKGIMIWEQKTMQSYASATDRLNVRRSLIIIEASIKNELEAFLFKNNTDITRFNVYSTLNDYLSRLGARGAFEIVGKDPGYRVICDLTNNTPATIDANELIVDVYLKPVKTIEYIRYRTIITKSGVNLSNLSGQLI